MILERLCRLQKLDNTHNFILHIEMLIKLLKFNILRYICIETINRNFLNWVHDHYLDLVLSDLLLPFLNSDNVLVTEKEFKKLRKTALTLCFQSQDKRYPSIGNAILQAIGVESHLSSEVIENSTLFKTYKSLVAYSQFETGIFENDFLNQLKTIIKTIETNQINIIKIN